VRRGRVPEVEPTQTRIVTLVLTGLAALILQVAVAPNIAILGVVPNFPLVAVGVIALYSSSMRSVAFAFVLGFCYDLIAQAPVGAMALILTISAFGLSTVSKGSLKGNWIVELAAFAIVILLGEILYAVVLAVVGFDTDIFYSLAFRALPGAMYAILIGFVVLFVISRIAGRDDRSARSLKKGSIPFQPSGKSRGQGRPLNRKLR